MVVAVPTALVLHLNRGGFLSGAKIWQNQPFDKLEANSIKVFARPENVMQEMFSLLYETFQLQCKLFGFDYLEAQQCSFKSLLKKSLKNRVVEFCICMACSLYTLFKSRGQDTKKIAGEIRGSGKNAFAKCFEMSPHMIQQPLYPYSPMTLS